MTIEAEQPSPKQILQIKGELTERWQQLPVEHRASMALVLFDDLLHSEYGLWLVEALALKIEQVVQEKGDDLSLPP